MSGFATDTTIETISVELPNSTRVEVTLERDGVNPEASVSCIYEDFLGATPVADFTYSRSVIIDGIYEEPRDWIATYEIRTGIDGSVVKRGRVSVTACDQDEATDMAVSAVHENVPEADPRLDPYVQIVHIEEEDT